MFVSYSPFVFSKSWKRPHLPLLFRSLPMCCPIPLMKCFRFSFHYVDAASQFSKFPLHNDSLEQDPAADAFPHSVLLLRSLLKWVHYNWLYPLVFALNLKTSILSRLPCTLYSLSFFNYELPGPFSSMFSTILLFPVTLLPKVIFACICIFPSNLCVQINSQSGACRIGCLWGVTDPCDKAPKNGMNAFKRNFSENPFFHHVRT